MVSINHWELKSIQKTPALWPCTHQLGEKLRVKVFYENNKKVMKGYHLRKASHSLLVGITLGYIYTNTAKSTW